MPLSASDRDPPEQALLRQDIVDEVRRAVLEAGNLRDLEERLKELAAHWSEMAPREMPDEDHS